MYCPDCGFWQAHTWHNESNRIKKWKLTTMKEINFYRCNGCDKINNSKVVFF